MFDYDFKTNADPDFKYLVADRKLCHDQTTQSQWSQKKLIWVPHPTEGFVSASVKSERGDLVTVEIVSTGKKVEVQRDDLQKMNPPRFNKVANMTELTCLNEASLLFNIKDRYYSELIYVSKHTYRRARKRTHVHTHPGEAQGRGGREVDTNNVI